MSAILAEIEPPVAVGVLGADGFIDRGDVGQIAKAALTSAARMSIKSHFVPRASDFELDEIPTKEATVLRLGGR